MTGRPHKLLVVPQLAGWKTQSTARGVWECSEISHQVMGIGDRLLLQARLDLVYEGPHVLKHK